jgi:hypothetical protein
VPPERSPAKGFLTLLTLPLSDLCQRGGPSAHLPRVTQRLDLRLTEYAGRGDGALPKVGSIVASPSLAKLTSDSAGSRPRSERRSYRTGSRRKTTALAVTGYIEVRLVKLGRAAKGPGRG